VFPIPIFLQGLMMGLAYVAPIGMQNMFVINSALTRTRRLAYWSALIVVFFDVTLALACFLGMGILMEKYPAVKTLILLVGSLLIIFIGVKLLLDKKEADAFVKVDVPLRKVIATACVVTWLNPHAILDGTMLLGAFRASMPLEDGWLFLMGVMAASCLWFIGLTVVLHIFQHRFNAKFVRLINVVCGVVIIGYGIKLFVDFIQLYL
jgi:L-lysine exporter family protein LysE/ArgO